MREYITVADDVATAYRDGEAVGQWEATALEYAAAGLPWPGCSCVDAARGDACRHGQAHYWGEGWSVARLRALAGLPPL